MICPVAIRPGKDSIAVKTQDGEIVNLIDWRFQAKDIIHS